MKQIVLFIAFIAVSFTATANPQDYPPTAFQLAQICQYVMKKDEVSKHISGVKTAAEAGWAFEESLFGGDVPGAKFLRQSEGLIKRYVESPAQATEEGWSKFVTAIVKYIKKEGFIKTLPASFYVEGCENIILKAIIAEQEAMEKNEVMLWRGCAEPAEVKQKQIDEKVQVYKSYAEREALIKAGKADEPEYKMVPIYTSFSLGLFSGFLFDGHKYHKLGAKTSTSACTYTYLSAFLFQKKLIEEGAEGFYQRMRERLPDYFSKNNLPEKCPADFAFLPFLTAMEEHYNPEGTFEGQNNVPSIIVEQFYPEARLIWGWRDDLQMLGDFHLFGVTLSKAELELERKKAKEAERMHVSNMRDERGEFLKAEYAVYGRGEVFHPKIIFPQKGRLIKLYDYPAEQGHESEGEDND